MPPTLALAPDTILRLQVAAVLVAALFLLVLLPLYALRRSRRARDPRRWLDCYETALERAINTSPGGDLGPEIPFRFHTYEGFLHHFTQRRHDLTLPAREAIVLAGMLFRENLMGCLVPYHGLLFVPFLSAVELLRVRRDARRALAAAR